MNRARERRGEGNENCVGKKPLGGERRTETGEDRWRGEG